MDNLIFVGYEFLSSFIPFLAVFVLFEYLRKKKGLYVSKLCYVSIIIFVFYIIAVYHFTGVGTLYDGLIYQLEMKQGQLNFIPFSKDIDTISYLLNILLFIPLGLLVPFICEKRDRVVDILILGFSFSLLIEISQIWNNRRTDIDDLILNVLGAVIGFVLYKLIIKVTKNKFGLQTISTIELLIYIAVLFIGRFLFFNELGMARLLYGF